MIAIRLAILNLRRSLGRNVLAMIVIAVAAGVLTSGLSLANGLPANAFATYREYFDGEIVAFAPGFAGVNPLDSATQPLVLRYVMDSGFNQVLKYFPVLEKGYYAPADWTYRAFDGQTITDLKAISGVAGVNIHHLMPASVKGEQCELKPLRQEDWPDHDLVSYHDYDFDVVVNGYGGPPVQLGEIMSVFVAQHKLDNRGIPYTDSSLPLTEYRARVVGIQAIPTRLAVWSCWLDGVPYTLQEEQAYLHSTDVYLKEETWDMLWSNHAGASSYPALNLGINVVNMAEVNVVRDRLRQAYPEYVFFSVSEFVEHLTRHSLIDRFYRLPPKFADGEHEVGHPLGKQDFGLVTATLLFLNGSMILASQMMTSIAGRRNEFGTLKALGARNKDVVLMIFFESVAIAVCGAVLGFLPLRLAGIHMSLTNGLAISKIAATTLRELGIVLGVTVTASALLAVLPAWKVARLSVMEVFRNEAK